MTTRNLMLDLDTLRYHTHDDTWRFVERSPYNGGVHVNAAGRMMHVVAAPASNRKVVATVLFEAQPVFAVIGDRDAEKPPGEGGTGWRWAWPFWPPEVEDVELLLWFDLEVIGELGTQGRLNGIVHEEMMQHYANGCPTNCSTHLAVDLGFGLAAHPYDPDNADGWSVDKIYEEYGGEGHETVGFVGIVAEALHKAYPNETPSTRGF